MAGPLSRLRGRRSADDEQPTEVALPPADGAAPTPETPAEAAGFAAATPDGPEADAAPDLPPADTDPTATPASTGPGFRDRSRLRRRLRFVRRARELALRDLGGLVFDLHRFGRDRGDLVAAKLAALGSLDGEMRTLEVTLDEREELTVLREPGIATCPRCGSLHASDANFCESCGLPVGRRAQLPAGPTAAPTAGGAGHTLTVVPGAGDRAAEAEALAPPETESPAPAETDPPAHPPAP